MTVVIQGFLRFPIKLHNKNIGKILFVSFSVFQIISNCQGDLNRLLCLSRWPLLCTLSTLSFIEWSVTAESLLSANIASKRTFFSPRDHKQLQQSTNWCSSISTREYECSQQINCIYLILICISQYEATSPLRFTLHFFIWRCERNSPISFLMIPTVCPSITPVVRLHL